MSDVSHDPASHYDRVTAAWTWLLGEELHYGVFDHGDEDLATATARLTALMVEAGALGAGNEVLDVGCGTGAPACQLAALGAKVTGITTSESGVEAAKARAAAAGVDDRVSFELRDGMDNGFADSSFDRVWVLESSHLMRDRQRLASECVRVLRPGGRLCLCDVMLVKELPFLEVRRLRQPFDLLRQVFGDARMEPLDAYVELLASAGLQVDAQRDLTTATKPTFARWRDNAERHRDHVEPLLGEDGWQQFVDAAEVLDGFWGEVLGYGLVAGLRP